LISNCVNNTLEQKHVIDPYKNKRKEREKREGRERGGREEEEVTNNN